MYLCFIDDQNKSHARALLFVLSSNNCLPVVKGSSDVSLLGQVNLKLILHLLRQIISLSQSKYFGFAFTPSNHSEIIPYYHLVVRMRIITIGKA